ncbi:hypothetical protein Hs30E_18790 [Lactococcus hodotermopsidis]|uniref:HTH iclR-type domain-containing protein n=1 Tax=Pseudolactococcus hodotermopsidis TaxID=2709157 RepID=A0A6A0BG41_9LACT|nr:hypothetical protein [Lactococcus hodotermopsidis]GFH43328.1 hypothetical protein Hs30E_18790 [Lactococcus hodotermopsidis]
MIVIFPFADGFAESVADRVADKLTDKLTPGEKAFLESLLLCFKKHEWISNAEAREASGVAEGSVKRYLRILSEKQILEAQGERKNRQYRLAKEDES